MCLSIVAKINPRTGDIESVEVSGATPEEYAQIKEAVAIAGGEPATADEALEYHMNGVVLTDPAEFPTVEEEERVRGS